MPRITVRRIDDGRNRDLVYLWFGDNMFVNHVNVATTVHVDHFWEPDVTKNEIARRLQNGEELTLELTIVETAAEAPADGGET